MTPRQLHDAIVSALAAAARASWLIESREGDALREAVAHAKQASGELRALAEARNRIHLRPRADFKRLHHALNKESE